MAKTIVITGAGAGLGRALARRFGARGDAVVLLGRTLPKVASVAEEIGANASAFECEVSSPASVRAAFGAIADRHPHIDVLINNAAIFQPFTIADATDEQIMSTTAINLCGPILCVREALPLMTAGSHIINVSSEAITLPFPHLLLYQSTKAGLEQFSAGLARELEDRNIRVSVVRAGQMYDEDAKGMDAPPEVVMRFVTAAAAAGIDVMKRPLTHYNAVTEAFDALINLHADLHVGLITLSARHADS